jgi:hypothetical protein
MCEIDPSTHKGMHSVLLLKTGCDISCQPPPRVTVHLLEGCLSHPEIPISECEPFSSINLNF